MPRKSLKIAPLAMPRKNPVREWVMSKENSWDYWLRKAELAKSDEEKTRAMAHAYVTDDGFYHYCHDIAGHHDMHEPFHGRMSRFVIGNPKSLQNVGQDRYWHTKQAWMLQAFRGSFKSSEASVAAPTWLIAREYVLMQDGKLEGVNIQIGLASEELTLPADHLQACCRLMDSEEYVKYFGEHGPKDRGKGAKWGRSGATTVFRSNKALRDPTIWTISLEAPRTGRHFDIIICDDLQAQRTAGSRSQLKETWKLYKLMFPLINPPATSNYSYMMIACTRWHEQDIYGKMEQENENKAKEDRTAILKMPVCTDAEIANCPTLIPTNQIPSLKSRGIDDFNTQYLLRPRSGKTTAFRSEWINHYDPLSDAFRNNPSLKDSYVVIGVDFCWIEAARRGDDGADHSAILVWRVFPGYKWYLVGQWREQVTRLETLQKLYEFYTSYGAKAVGFSISDRRHVESDMERFEREHKMVFNKHWVSDLASYATQEDTTKNRKIIGTLQPLFQNGQVFLPLGVTWFEQEIIDCPMGITDDGMDAFVCAVNAAYPATPSPRESVYESENIWLKHTEALLKGRPIFLNGKPVRGSASRAARHRSTRRARNWSR